jgi:diguanylate cyclase (GGDEF)-like protein
VIILIGFAAVGITSYTTYSEIIKDDIVNISKLTATNIYSDIRNELTKPIFVSLTMANDSFLKNWLIEEKEAEDVSSHQHKLQQYLLGIKTKYNYNSVFLVSETSKYYYHYNGINKIVSKTDEHDQWYYSFLDSGLSYDLDVDSDEANQNRLTVFVNCRITDEDGKLLGVTGVGLDINHVQSLLKAFEDEFDLEAMLFNQKGVIQVHSNSVDIENGNIFDTDTLSSHKESITENLNSLEIMKSETTIFDGYYITRYIEDLNWYLLVKKDTSVLEESFESQIIKLLIVYFIIASGVLFIVNIIIKRNGRAMMSMSKTDLLTNLLNRRGFNDNMSKVIDELSPAKPFYVFVFDIDNFKNVNDIHGHLVGDNVLKEVSRLASDIFAEKGVISRWGGDEFAGYIFGEKEQVIKDLDRFYQRLKETRGLSLYGTTVSMGVTRAYSVDTVDTLIYRADKALYEVKGTGKAKYCILDEQE